jgi:hypothetical protein
VAARARAVMPSAWLRPARALGRARANRRARSAAPLSAPCAGATRRSVLLSGRGSWTAART